MLLSNWLHTRIRALLSKSPKTEFLKTDPVDKADTCNKQLYGWKSTFDYAQNMQIQTILRKRKVSSGPSLSIHTFYRIHWFCKRTAKILIRLRGPRGVWYMYLLFIRTLYSVQWFCQKTRFRMARSIYEVRKYRSEWNAIPVHFHSQINQNASSRTCWHVRPAKIQISWRICAS